MNILKGRNSMDKIKRDVSALKNVKDSEKMSNELMEEWSYVKI